MCRTPDTTKPFGVFRFNGKEAQLFHFEDPGSKFTLQQDMFEQIEDTGVFTGDELNKIAMLKDLVSLIDGGDPATLVK